MHIRVLRQAILFIYKPVCLLTVASLYVICLIGQTRIWCDNLEIARCTCLECCWNSLACRYFIKTVATRCCAVFCAHMTKFVVRYNKLWRATAGTISRKMNDYKKGYDMLSTSKGLEIMTRALMVQRTVNVLADVPLISHICIPYIPFPKSISHSLLAEHGFAWAWAAQDSIYPPYAYWIWV